MAKKPARYSVKSDLVQGILEAELSTVTKRVYLERIRTILKENNQTLFYILTHPEFYIRWISDWSDAPATQKSYTSAILALFRYNPGLKEQQPRAHEAWRAFFDQADSKVEERYKNNEPNERQKEGYVPFPEIVKMRDSLTPGSIERLLLAFYTYIPPLRCDFNRLRVYRTREIPSTSGKLEANFVHVPPTSAPARLVLTEYKTKSTHDQLEQELPPELTEEIHASLAEQPREWVFMDASSPPKPFTPGAFRKWANRVLERLFKKPLTISLIRHSFVNTLDFNNLTIAEKERIATAMTHSAAMQDRYRLIFNKDSNKAKSDSIKEE